MSQDSWDRYWAEGHAHSLPTTFDGFYGESTQAFWRRQAADLGPDDCVLDLGCGNGGLLRFLQLQFRAGAAPALLGVDAAAVHSEVLALGAAPGGVRIHERTPFARLPFEDASVSLVASQFGIEYGNEDRSWSELFRVTRPAAQVAFVLHQRGSRLDRVAADEVTLAESGLAPNGLLAAAQALLAYLPQAATAAGRTALNRDPRAVAARRRYNRAVEALVNLAGLLQHGEPAQEILSPVADLLSQAGSRAVEESVQRLQAVRERLTDHLARIRALRAVALDPEALAGITARLEDAGFRVEAPATLVEQDHAIGWTLTGRRTTA